MARSKRKESVSSTFEIDERYHDISEMKNYLADFKWSSKSKIKYLSAPLAFDIETTSFYEDGKKRATMYAFVFGVNGHCFLGRTWGEFLTCLDIIVKRYDLGEKKRAIVWVHNLPYEFQWMAKWLEVEYVFALDERKPVEVRLKNGIVFRCSYALSGYSLASVGKNLLKYRVEKKIGDLDYSIIRHSKTPLNAKEWGYIINDGLVVMAYIKEEIEANGKITRIPLTKTGKVRRYTRNACLYPMGADHKKGVFESLKYHRLMEQLTMETDEFEMVQEAFQGGFTHSNPINTNQVIEDVTSYDFTSSYPAVMVYSNRFPMSKGEKVTIQNKEHFRKLLDKYACIFKIRFTNIRAKDCIDFPISLSKCTSIQNAKTSNGRVVSASVLETTITELDFEIIEAFYDYDKIAIGDFWRYLRGYLPTPFVKSILDLYEKKTSLKGVDGMETEYMYSKEMLNAEYGQTATSPIRPENEYIGGEWKQTEPNVEESLERYNKSFKRFLSYVWGVYVTALARWNLFTGIRESGHDYVYADTDSIKIRHGENHLPYIKRYNERVERLLKEAMKHHGLPFDLCCPKTIKGEPKLLGVWDYDGHYKRFKTLGAKRYIVEYDEGHEIEYKDEKGKKILLPYSLTNSGLNKKKVVPWLYEKAIKQGKSIFDVYDDELLVPAKHTGKNTHTYIDEETEGLLKDYKGQTYAYHELGSIHMEEASYSLSMAQEFMLFLNEIKEEHDEK